MKALLVRVGIDQSGKSGGWNAPVKLDTWEFAYVPIFEDEGKGKDGIKKKPIRAGYETTYKQFQTPCEKFGKEHELTPRFDDWNSHLDPDFRYLTYGDEGQKEVQLDKQKLVEDDILAFYTGLKSPSTAPGKLVYALIGLYRLADKPRRACDIPKEEWSKNAHTRREPKKDDIVFSGKPNVSGRLERCIPIGRYYTPPGKRIPRYYLDPELQKIWGESKPIYLQRRPYHHVLYNAERFYKWFNSQNIKLVACNN